MRRLENYLGWLTRCTPTRWWHDSAIPDEIDRAIRNGATGVTTNPVLTYRSLLAAPEFWRGRVEAIPASLTPGERAEALLRIVAVYAAEQFKGVYEASDHSLGYALGQVNPDYAGDADRMLAQARRYAEWAPNIAIKLPTTRAAVEVVEELAASGVAVCTTLNFTVAQALAAAEAYERGAARAKAAGREVKPCFVVQQGARLDEYLIECAKDSRLGIGEDTIRNAGNLVTKKSYDLFKARGYRAKIMPAGLRGVHYLTRFAGADMVFSLQTRVQDMVNAAEPARTEHIGEPDDPAVLRELLTIPEFCRAYGEDALTPREFVTYGVTQRTLSQFLWTGWIPLETYGASGSSRWF